MLASEGDRATPGVVVRALAAGVIPVASRLPAYEELLAEGRYGLEFEPGDTQTLAAQLARLVSEPDLRASLRAASEPLRQTLRWPRVAEEVQAVYDGLLARGVTTGGPRSRRGAS